MSVDFFGVAPSAECERIRVRINAALAEAAYWNEWAPLERSLVVNLMAWAHSLGLLETLVVDRADIAAMQDRIDSLRRGTT
jgi:hypothetical protein